MQAAKIAACGVQRYFIRIVDKASVKKTKLKLGIVFRRKFKNRKLETYEWIIL